MATRQKYYLEFQKTLPHYYFVSLFERRSRSERTFSSYMLRLVRALHRVKKEDVLLLSVISYTYIAHWSAFRFFCSQLSTHPLCRLNRFLIAFRFCSLLPHLAASLFVVLRVYVVMVDDDSGFKYRKIWLSQTEWLNLSYI